MSPVSALCILTLLHHATTSYIERRVPQDQLQTNVTKASSCHHKSRAGDTVTVHYNGSLTDGTVFDSSYDRDAPIEFTLGAGQVIQGWDEGLLKMCPGEERHLTIPSNLAYGDSSMGAIPPGATLIFDTLLVAVKSSTESAPDQEAAFGIQTAPAKDPAKPEPTSRPKPVEQDLEDDKNAVEDEDDSHEDDTSDKEAAEKAPAPGKSEEAKPKINDIMTFGPAMPTRLPDLPVTGLQGATSEAAAVASQQPIPGPPPKHPGHQPDNKPGVVNGECRLLGPFALIVQGGLGILALSSLVFKRWRERPRRPFKIWFFDASKQVFGSALLHVLNLLMSIFSTADFDLAHQAQLLTESFQNAQTRQVNPCSWYLINIAIDTTIGIPILVILLKLLHHGFALTPLARPTESIKSGHYGQPPRVTWWLKQSLIYFVGLALMKLCVFFIIQLLPWIVLVGDWALRWTEGNTTTQVAFVMFVFPLIMNALQYYIIDSFIKDQSSGHELLPSDEGSDGTQSSYHTIDARDSLDSEDSDRAKEATRHAGQAPESETFREERSPTRGPRLKDA